MTRVTVPIGEDIGFLPGTEEEKMQPWMGALEDNLDVLNASDESGGEWGRAATRDLVREPLRRAHRAAAAGLAPHSGRA